MGTKFFSGVLKWSDFYMSTVLYEIWIEIGGSGVVVAIPSK